MMFSYGFTGFRVAATVDAIGADSLAVTSQRRVAALHA
jgi:hypothetical protein